MMSKKQFIESEKDCAELLGISLEQYHKKLQNIKAPRFNEQSRKKDSTILNKLGIKEENLKKRIF